MLWKHPASCLHGRIPQSLLWHLNRRSPEDDCCIVSSSWCSHSGQICPQSVFWPGDLDLWPMTLTFKLDLDILSLDLHTKIQVRMSVCSARRAITHTHTRCQNYYTHLCVFHWKYTRKTMIQYESIGWVLSANKKLFLTEFTYHTKNTSTPEWPWLSI